MSESPDKLVKRELAKWDGVQLVAKERTGSGHWRYVLNIKGIERAIIVASTASDHRAIENNRTLIARTCRALGATLAAQAKKAAKAAKTEAAPVVPGIPGYTAVLAARMAQELACDAELGHWQLVSEDGVMMARAQTYAGLLKCLPPMGTSGPELFLVPIGYRRTLHLAAHRPTSNAG